MDPTTAFGLASGVAQFLSFAIELFLSSREIYVSGRGATTQIRNMESIYTQLRDLNSELESPSSSITQTATKGNNPCLRIHIDAIKKLSQACKQDCIQLLEVIHQLQGGSGSRGPWKSFKIALKTAWKTKEIAEVERRLQRAQSALTLEICAITREWQSLFQKDLEAIRHGQWNTCAQLSRRLDNITNILSNLQGTIKGRDEMADKDPLKYEDITDLQDRMIQLSITKAELAKEQAVLESLSFDEQPNRYLAVPEAHNQTFKWAFKHPMDQPDGQPNNDLLAWLQVGEGFFWVTGKPGSGKSTFMKFLTDNPKTIETLSIWSNSKPVIVVSHFFWRAGTSMQQSWQGLLQSLLYEIFQKVPDLIESICTEIWMKEPTELSQEAWSLSSLNIVLQRIADQETIPAKICLFIDGLDEYEGNHLDACEALRKLSLSPHFKLCVSSRPWNVFEDFFGNLLYSKLHIHLLTGNDIRSYVESRLFQHPRWDEVNAEAKNVESLVNQIINRARGVFLWVSLVTQQLRDSLTEGDSFSDMQKRLDCIPLDLEQFFKQILESVDVYRHEKMATTLKMAMAVHGSAPFEIYHFREEEYEDEEYDSKLRPDSLGRHLIEKWRRDIRRRLNGRCRGLLEVNHTRVQFLHGTVSDYLKTSEMTKFLNQKAPAQSNLNLSILRACVAYITVAGILFHQNQLTFAIEEAINQARILGDDPAVLQLLNRIALRVREGERSRELFWKKACNAPLFGFLCQAVPKLPIYLRSYQDKGIFVFVFLKYISIRNGREFDGDLHYVQLLVNRQVHNTSPLANVIQDVWKEMLSFISLPNSAVMEPQSPYSVDFDTTPWSWDWVLHSNIVCIMLELGADPNITVSGQPVWLSFALMSFYIVFTDICTQILFLNNLDRFLRHASNTSVLISSSSAESPSHSKTSLEIFLGHLENTPKSGRTSFLLQVTEKLSRKAESWGVKTPSYISLWESEPHAGSSEIDIFSPSTKNHDPGILQTRKRTLEDEGKEEGNDDEEAMSHKKPAILPRSSSG